MTVAQNEREIQLLKEIDEVEFQRKETSDEVRKMRMALANAETILIGAKINKERLMEELRRLRNSM